MTNKEAIRLIRNLPTMCEFTDAYGEPIDSDVYYKAVDMAISALQTQDLQPTCNQLATDTISRQAAIDALNAYEDVVDTASQVFTIRGCKKAITNLPSAQPEPRWIPVSKRMPEDGENCLVSVRCSNDFLVDKGTYSTDLFNVDEEDFFGNRGESGWYYLSSEYGYCKILNVIAWMPEPRPYKEIKDEDLIERQAAIEALDQIFDRCEEIEAHLPEGDPDRTGYKMYPDYMTVWKYLHQLSSAQPESNCLGCKHAGMWEDEVEYGYPSPCTRCKRMANDNYEQ